MGYKTWINLVFIRWQTDHQEWLKNIAKEIFIKAKHLIELKKNKKERR
jgi:hypothetical protein